MLVVSALLLMSQMANATDTTSFLSKPTGKYSVGYQDFFVINPTLCPDKFYQKGVNESSFANDKYCHEMVIRAYYPSTQKINSGDKYYQPYLSELNKYYATRNRLTESEMNLLDSNLVIQTYTQQNLSPVKNKHFPTILFLSGSGQSSSTYSNLISNLVSHGYIVIGIDSVFANGPLQLANGNIVSWLESYNDNGRLENLADLEFVNDNLQKIFAKSNLKNIIDYKNIGLLGHSMGAMNLVDYLREHNNPNIKATILMDPGNMLSYHVSQEHKIYIIETPKMPMFLLWSANFKLNMNESMALNKSDYEVILSPNLASESNFTNHENFSDYSTLQYHPAFAQPKVSPNLDVGSGDGY